MFRGLMRKQSRSSVKRSRTISEESALLQTHGADILQLQHAAGNQAVQRLIAERLGPSADDMLATTQEQRGLWKVDKPLRPEKGAAAGSETGLVNDDAGYRIW